MNEHTIFLNHYQPLKSLAVTFDASSSLLAFFVTNIKTVPTAKRRTQTRYVKLIPDVVHLKSLYSYHHKNTKMARPTKVTVIIYIAF